MIGPRNSRLFAFEAAIQQELRNLEIKAGIDVPRLDGVDFKHLRSNAQPMSPAHVPTAIASKQKNNVMVKRDTAQRAIVLPLESFAVVSNRHEGNYPCHVISKSGGQCSFLHYPESR